MIRPVAADGRIETGGAFSPIRRLRVIERIAAAASARIALIVAPAGYGKSMALRQYLETAGESVRYDVHAENATLLGFVRGFANALSEAAPDARKTVSGAYEKSLSSKTPGADLALWMHAHLKTYTGLIAIDDLHLAEADPEISRFLVALIERTKGRARWILASRSTLDLPVGSWLAYGEMDLNVDETDLRFSMDEARQTAGAAKVRVRDEELEEILQMTQGWPTALSFALRSSTRSVDLRNIAATTREMIYRYLAEQVYASLGEAERDILHFTAYLPEIDLDVLRSGGYPRAKAVLETLRGKVAFIYPERPGVYRCQDLFRDFLQHELELLGDAAVLEVQLRAASALEAAGRISGALWAFTQARATPQVLRLLETHGFELVEQACGDVVAAALESLPHDVRSCGAVVLGLRGAREAAAGRFDRAQPLLERAVARAEEPALHAALCVQLALLLLNQGRDACALLERLITPELAAPSRAEAASVLAVAYAYAGRSEEARETIEQVQLLAPSIERDEVQAKILQRVAAAALHLHLDPVEIRSLYRRAHALASEAGLFNTSAHALTGLSNVALFFDQDVTRAVWFSQQAVGAASKAGDRFALQTALLQLIDIEAKRGDRERLAALEQQFLATATTDAARMAYIIPTRALVAAWDGRFDEAQRLSATVDDGSFYVFDRIFNASMNALYAVACGQRERAIALVQGALDRFDAAEFPFEYGRRLAEMGRYVCVVVEALAGRQTSATRLLTRIAESSEAPAIEAMRDCATAVCRVVRAPAMIDDLQECVEHLRAVGYAGVARAIEPAVRQCVQAAEQRERSVLTKAEIAVLKALAQGRSPKDIALETGRSVYTVQVHVQNVIRKLGCSGRNEALTLARKQGLLA